MSAVTDLDAVLDILWMVPLPDNARGLLAGTNGSGVVSGRPGFRGMSLTSTSNPAGEYDVVLYFSSLSPHAGSLTMLRQLAGCVRPGGLVVVGFENPLQLLGRPSWRAAARLLSGLLVHRRIRRLMVQVPLRWGGSYGVFPSWQAPRELVPLEDSVAMIYYLNQRVFPSTARWRERLLRPFLWGRAYEALPPGYLVWGTRG